MERSTMETTQIADNYAVTAQIPPEAVSAIAGAGFVAIICNRPDDEEPGQPPAATIRAACEAAGIAFHHVPVSTTLTPESVLLHRSIIESSGGPVLAYCRSGQRSSIIYEAGLS